MAQYYLLRELDDLSLEDLHKSVKPTKKEKTSKDDKPRNKDQPSNDVIPQKLVVLNKSHQIKQRKVYERTKKVETRFIKPKRNIDHYNVAPTSHFEQLPTDCFLHIFEFMELTEIKRLAYRMSPCITLQLLETESNQGFYRLLCQEQMRMDLNCAIDSINERGKVRGNSRIRRYNRRVEDSSNRTILGPIKDLRENLRVCVLKAKSLFPYWFNENSALNKSVYEAVKHSYSINETPVYHNLSEHHQSISDQYKEKEEKEAVEKTNSFLEKLEKQVEKQSKRPSKWKQIWNGCFLQNLVNSTINATVEFEKRAQKDSPLISELASYLKTMSGLLTLENTQLRRKIMFETLTRRRVLTRTVFFAKLVGILYSFRDQYLPEQIEQQFEKLLDFFIEESIAHGVETCPLVDCFIENNSPIHMILRSGHTPLSVNIITKHWKIIKRTSRDFRFYLFVKCIWQLVDFKVIHALFKFGIVDSSILTHNFTNRGSRSVDIYFMTTIDKWNMNDNHITYFGNIFNLMVTTLDERGTEHYKKREIRSHSSLFSSSNPSVMLFLHRISQYRPSTKGNVADFFAEAIQKLKDKVITSSLADDRPTFEYVNFGKNKFATL